MAKRQPGIALIFLCVVASSLVAQDVQPNANQQTTAKEIVAGIIRASKSVSALSVKTEVKESYGIPIKVGAGMGKKRTTFIEQWHVDSKRRGWNRASGKTVSTPQDGEAIETVFEQTAVFDGKRGESLQVQTKPAGTKRHQAKVETHLVGRGDSPFRLAIMASHELFAVFERRAWTLSPDQEWDEHNVKVIQAVSGTTNGESKTEFWVDPDRNFTIVRRRFLHRPSPDDRWAVTNTVDCFAHEQISPGVWLPTMVRKRQYLVVDDGSDPMLFMRRDLLCTNWSVNEEIAPDKLRINYPPGTKVRGRLEEFQAGLRKSISFFVEPITTTLQRKILNTDAIAYAEIDVTAFVDVNTEQVTPARFDFGLLRANLKELSKSKKEPRSLYLMFDFGMIGHDRNLSNFVRGGVKEICETAGFEDIHTSNRWHNVNKQWESVDSRLPSVADESNLGNQLVEVFPIRTRLSRVLLKDADYFIEIKNGLLVDSKSILDDQSKQLIESAVINENLAGKSVHLKFLVGSTRERAPGIEDAALIQKDSEPQLQVVEFLRSLGFGPVRVTALNGPSNYVSTYGVSAD